jgi:uridine kinase
MCPGGDTVVVAIVGASGSGKSELARLAAQLLRARGAGDVVVVPSDRYWKTTLYRETMYERVKEQMMRCEYNRDHPDHYDHDLLAG